MAANGADSGIAQSLTANQGKEARRKAFHMNCANLPIPPAYQRPEAQSWSSVKGLIDKNPSPGATPRDATNWHQFGPIIQEQRVMEFFKALFFREDLPQFSPGLPFDEYTPEGNIKMPLRQFKEIFDAEICRVINEKISNNTLNISNNSKVNGCNYLWHYIYPTVFNIPDMNIEEFQRFFLTWVGAVKDRGQNVNIKISPSADAPLWTLSQSPDLGRFCSRINVPYDEMIITLERDTFRQLQFTEIPLRDFFSAAPELMEIKGIDVPHSFKDIYLTVINKAEYNTYIERDDPVGLYVKMNVRTGMQVFPGSYIYKYNILKTLFANHHVLNVHPQLMYIFNQDYIAAEKVANNTRDPKRFFWGNTHLYLPPLDDTMSSRAKYTEFLAFSMAFYYFVNKIAETNPEFLLRTSMNDKIAYMLSGTVLDDILKVPANKAEFDMYIRWATKGQLVLSLKDVKRLLTAYIAHVDTVSAFRVRKYKVHLIRHAFSCDNLAKAQAVATSGSGFLGKITVAFRKRAYRGALGVDPHLTEFGIQQALALRTQIQEMGITYGTILTSHLRRAIETALIVFGPAAQVEAYFGIRGLSDGPGPALPIQVIPGLAEHHKPPQPPANQSIGFAALRAAFSATPIVNLGNMLDSEGRDLTSTYYVKGTFMAPIFERLLNDGRITAVIMHNNSMRDIYSSIPNSYTFNNTDAGTYPRPYNCELWKMQLEYKQLGNKLSTLFDAAPGESPFILPPEALRDTPDKFDTEEKRSAVAGNRCGGLIDVPPPPAAATAGLPRGPGFRSNTNLGNTREPASAAVATTSGRVSNSANNWGAAGTGLGIVSVPTTSNNLTLRGVVEPAAANNWGAAGTGLGMPPRTLGTGFRSNINLGNVREPATAQASELNTVVAAPAPPAQKGFFAKLFGRGHRTRRRGLKKRRTTRRKVQKK